MESCFTDTYCTTADVVRNATVAEVCAIQVYTGRNNTVPAFYPPDVEKYLPAVIPVVERHVGYSLTERPAKPLPPASGAFDRGAYIGDAFVLPIRCEEMILGHLLLVNPKIRDVQTIDIAEFAVHHLQAVMAMDKEIADLQACNAEYEIRQRETHHRMKNSLQTVTSLLSLQAEESARPEIVIHLQEAVSRIRTIERLHSQIATTNHPSGISPVAYFTPLIETIVETFPTRPPVSLIMDFDEMSIAGSTVGTLGLVVNELITNALFYAFRGVEARELRVCLHHKGNQLILTVRDNGIGLPDTFDSRNPETTGLGTTIVRFLVERMDGTVEYRSDSGTIVTITVPL